MSQLIVKCRFEGKTKRITFASADKCRLSALYARVAQCFSLGASSYHLAYFDDEEGEENVIQTDVDLRDAIAFYAEGAGDDDTHAPWKSSAASSISMESDLPTWVNNRKITLRCYVVVEYDGPSLSDTGSQVDGTIDEASTQYTRSSDYTSDHSLRSGHSLPGMRQMEQEAEELEEEEEVYADEDFEDVDGKILDDPSPPSRSTPIPRVPGPSSTLSGSELGARWLREQEERVSRKLGPRSSNSGGASGSTSSHRTDSIAGSFGDSDDEISIYEDGRGDLELMQDAKGKWYYSYQTSEASGSTAGGASSPPITEPVPQHQQEADFVDEPAGPPALAPDCSACGIRLEVLRYACTICGESHMWLEGQEGKARPDVGGVGSTGSSSSTGAEWRPPHGGSEEVDDEDRLVQELGDALATSVTSGDTPTPPASPTRTSQELHHQQQQQSSPPRRHGYELCPGCIEVQGIAHAKAMSREDAVTQQRRLAGTRHTFRELIWGGKGWTEIEYHDDCNCSICNVKLFQNRFKCVSCNNFNLCRSCHQNAQEIHPAHCFLAIPDQSQKIRPPSTTVPQQAAAAIPVMAKHPGVFCHNCLQDIVGPRFHCAVCPSWDLCIQCEGVTAAVTGTGSHTADHIMMKIPLPLAGREVSHVSRRARERWAQQDCTVVGTLGRRSPTNETVYGGGNTAGGGVVVRDTLDHGVQCKGCNEWIMGRRYQCANCPSDPVPFNLCSICELRSYKLHNPTHVFIKFDRPVHYPLQSPFPVLPPLYKLPVGQVRSTMPLDPTDPTAYLKCVFHSSTLCDIHVGPIQGAWLRCAQCATSFDVCQDCESVAGHDPSHVFVVFKSEVDMPTFRALAALSSTHSRPLIHQHVYL